MCLISYLSDGLLLEPVEYEVIGLGSLKLGGHVACSVDGTECEVAISSFDVASDLSVEHVCSPWLCNVPVELINPLESTISGNGTISVSGVLEHPVETLKLGVDPLGSRGGLGVRNAVSAQIPGSDIAGDM